MNNSIIVFSFHVYYSNCLLVCFMQPYFLLNKKGVPLAPSLDPPLTFQQGGGLK